MKIIGVKGGSSKKPTIICPGTQFLQPFMFLYIQDWAVSNEKTDIETVEALFNYFHDVITNHSNIAKWYTQGKVSAQIIQPSYQKGP